VLAAWAYNTAQLPGMLPRRPLPYRPSADAAKAEAPKPDPIVEMDTKILEQVKSDQAELKSNMKYLTDRIGPRLTVLRSSIAPAIGHSIDSRNWDFRTCTWSPGRLPIAGHAVRLREEFSLQSTQHSRWLPRGGLPARMERFAARSWFDVRQVGRPGQIPGKTEGSDCLVRAPEGDGSSGKSPDDTLGRRNNSRCPSQRRGALRFGRVSKNPHGAYENDFR